MILGSHDSNLPPYIRFYILDIFIEDRHIYAFLSSPILYIRFCQSGEDRCPLPCVMLYYSFFVTKNTHEPTLIPPLRHVLDFTLSIEGRYIRIYIPLCCVQN